LNPTNTIAITSPAYTTKSLQGFDLLFLGMVKKSKAMAAEKRVLSAPFRVCEASKIHYLSVSELHQRKYHSVETLSGFETRTMKMHSSTKSLTKQYYIEISLSDAIQKLQRSLFGRF
jgi:hypothetical protein